VGEGQFPTQDDVTIMKIREYLRSKAFMERFGKQNLDYEPAIAMIWATRHYAKHNARTLLLHGGSLGLATKYSRRIVILDAYDEDEQSLLILE
jgi:hypothetical protein